MAMPRRTAVVVNGGEPPEMCPRAYLLRPSASHVSLSGSTCSAHDVRVCGTPQVQAEVWETSAQNRRCFVCQNADAEEISRCMWCRRIYACSVHFRAYHRLRSRCRPFHLQPAQSDHRDELDAQGKFHLRLTASTQIEKGQIILSDRSCLATPHPHSVPNCPVCLCRLRADSFQRCTTCSIPMCGSSGCANSPIHQIECRVLTENKINLSSLESNFSQPHFIYSVIILLRMWALEGGPGPLRSQACATHINTATTLNHDRSVDHTLEEGNPPPRHQDVHRKGETFELREFLFQLPDHAETRRKLGEWKMFQLDVVDFLRGRCFMASQKSDEQMHRLLGIFMANSLALDARLTKTGDTPEDGRHLIQGRLMFPLFSLINHSCLSNANYQIQADPKEAGVFNLTLKARRCISQGEEITISYLPSILGNHKRRRRIQSEFYFNCQCPRCSDPTECQTLVSAITCEACESGFMLPKDTLNSYAEWTCSDCDFELPVGIVETKIDLIEEELSELCVKEDLARIDEFIGHYSGSVLHPNHYLLLLARRNHLFISRKSLITRLSSSDGGDVQNSQKSRAETYQDVAWIIQRLQCESCF